MNYGFIEREPPLGNWVLGEVGEPAQILQSNRDWTPYLPVVEHQIKNLWDSCGCVSFSAWNCLEILHKRLYGIEINKSDRFTVVHSGTIPDKGNYIDAVAECIRKHWSVDEQEYPFVGGQMEYYKPLTPELEAKAQEQYTYTMNYRWADWAGCDPEVLWDALQYSPLQASVHTWGQIVDGVYQRPTTEQTNHLVTIFKGEYEKYWWIFDHYEQSIRKMAWNYYFGSAMTYSLKKKSMENEFIKIIKDANSAAVGFWIPATSEAALKSMAEAYQKTVHKKADGSIDWDKTIEGTLNLK